MQQKFTFSKDERLCNKTVLERLFTEGSTIFAFPFKLIYLPNFNQGKYPVQVVFSVPKRNFKHAVSRNHIRRRMREAFRLNKHVLYESLNANELNFSVMIIYIEKEIKEYAVIEKGMKMVFKKWMKKLK